MKKLILIGASLFFVLLCRGQKIDKAEYFIDNDPGFGLATSIPIITPAKDVSLSFQVNATTLSEGFHMIVLRARNDEGFWSVTRQQVFYVYEIENVTGSKINKVEYFIDNDPGFGVAVPIPVSIPDKKLSLSYTVDVTGLSNGFHMMVLRAHDEEGRWSTTRQQVFYVYQIQSATIRKINKVEYFIDSDPGFGKAVPVTVASPGKLQSLSFIVNVSSLQQGFHMIVVRAHDESGLWSNTRQQIFYIYKNNPAVSLNITGIEYFIDNDPGFGKGTTVLIPTPDNKVSIDFIANLNGITNGDHFLYIRAKDELNRWSHTLIQAFSSATTGLSEEEVVSWFKLYPNPNEGNFILEFGDLNSRAVNITINDLNGRIVYSKKMDGEIIPLTVNLPEGIYILKVESGDRSFKQKLIIRK
jgi:hypothetical protein